MTQKSAAAPARRRARLVGTTVFGLVVAALTAIFSVQIIQQAWSGDRSALPADCRSGLQSLLVALQRARQSAAEQTGEIAAVEAFRAAVEPAWAGAAGLERVCASDPPAVALLREVHALRYAEEQAVRRNAHELTPARRSVEQLAGKLLGLY